MELYWNDRYRTVELKNSLGFKLQSESCVVFRCPIILFIVYGQHMRSYSLKKFNVT
jgi:hypothetical protein